MGTSTEDRFIGQLRGGTAGLNALFPVIAVASSGRYPATALADVPDMWRDAFAIEGDVLRVRPELAALVRFERANLVDSTNIRGCDLVWCRNVLIYFTDDARRRVIDRLIAATAPGGFIFVGYSETLRDEPELRAVRAGEATYYVRGARQTAAPTLPRPIAVPDAPDLIPDLELTPPPMRIPLAPPPEDLYELRGHPTTREVTAELTTRLAIAGLRRLVIDLDAADLLADELAPVLRRARAAARAAQVELALRATRAGTKRWLARHRLDEEAP